MGSYTTQCTGDFYNLGFYHASMKAGLRISIKDYSKSLKVQLVHVPFSQRQFRVRMAGKPWPASGQPVSITRVMTALRKALAGTVAH